jgi:phosphate:Na+ symporter
MVFSFDIWKILAGVAIFLLGMGFMEEALRSLAGRKFKIFLKKQTSSKPKAIGGGAVVTAILQSSSIVNLLVLSLVGAGVIKMQNALAVMLGSNLGTTVNSWIVATLGFSFNIENVALPVAGITGICLSFFSKGNRMFQWCQFLLGFSFLFIGLTYIKEGMMEIVVHSEVGQLKQYPVIAFFIAGILLTALLQASSATIAITLSALHANAISLHEATAISLGSEIGTTFKLFLASAKGLPVKKRVALGNFMLNKVTVTILFFLLRPVNSLLAEIFRGKNDLLALVFFQSLVNIAGIVIFYPLLNTMGRFLEKRYTASDEGSMFISKVPVAETDLAMDALEKESRYFIFYVMDFISASFNTKSGMPAEMVRKNFYHKSIMEKYAYIKHLHGEMHGFYVQLQSGALTGKEVPVRLQQLISAVRNAMYAAKSMRDALHDIEQFRNSSNDVKYNFYTAASKEMATFLNEMSALMLSENTTGRFEEIARIQQAVQHGYTQSLQELYKEGMARHVSEAEISTFINYNREMYTACKSMIFSLKEYLLNPKEAEYFDELPGFIR